MILAENKKALHFFTVQEKFQAGLKLTGPEVKSIKSGRIDLKGSFVEIIYHGKSNQPEAWLTSAQVAKYLKSGYAQQSYNPIRNRKLLLLRKEINYLAGKIKEQGLTVIPLSVYTNQRLIKVEIALVKGKTKFDKRETIKKREFERRKNQILKH